MSGAKAQQAVGRPGRYGPYPEYKDSGVEWLGEIPAHWEVRRLKNLIDVPITDGPHESPEFLPEGVPFLSVDGIQDGELVFEGCRHVSEEDHAKYRRKVAPRRDDVLFGKAASTGKIARVRVGFEFSIWSPLALIRPRLGVVGPAFLELALKAASTQAQIDVLCTHSTQNNISMDDIPLLALAIAPLGEQRAISAFLDRETAKIDALVAKRKRLVELLHEKRTALISHAVTKGLDPNVPMKDSGVEWLGEIPAHWETNQLRHVASIRVSTVDKTQEDGERLVQCVGTKHVFNSPGIGDGMDFEMVSATPKELREFSLHRGDVVVTKDSVVPDNIAAVSIVEEELADVVCGYHMAIVRAHAGQLASRFMFWQMSSRPLFHQFLSAARGVTIIGLSPGEMGAARLAVPLLREQRTIAAFLDLETAKIDALAAKVGEGIERLKEYRTALISAAVTGKIDVRQASIPEAG